ncbi:MAG: site-specific integrase [Pseudomonadota bacterium]|nr:site-specific integrase [Pseudomonadota bacterium]
MSKPKPKSGTAGVYYRDDGAPRWEVKIRWTDRKGKKQHLPTQRYPVNPHAAPGDADHITRARKDAEALAAREWQAIATHGKPHSMRMDAWTLRALLERYLEDLEKGRVDHKATKTEKSTIRMLLGKGKGHNAAGFPHIVDTWVKDLEYSDFVGDGERSLQSLLKDRDGMQAGASALKRALTVVRGVFVRAKGEWQIELENPLQTIRGLSVNDARERVITEDEWNKIVRELRKHEQGTQDAIVFARFTAARRSEVVKLDWDDIDFRQKTARLRETKSRVGKNAERIIPLPAAALEIAVARAQPGQAKKPLTAEELTDSPRKGPVFTSGKGTRLRPDTLTQAWGRACARAGVDGARVHDLRHTRITELGRFLTAAETARVSGHTDLATFFRYFNPDPVETGRKIDAMEQGKKSSGAIKQAAEALAALSPDDFAAAIAAAIESRARSVAGK